MRPILILGMFRSGTSAVANCFSRLGFYLGDDGGMFPADEHNPDGYFEMKEQIQLNRKLLSFFDMRYFRIDEVPPDWRSLPMAEALVQEVESFLARKFEGRRLCGWKEPQTSLLLPMYQAALDGLGLRPLYVICVRNPVDVAASHSRHVTSPFSRESATGLWLHYTLSALRYTSSSDRLVIPYEGFLEDPGAYIGAAVSQLGIGPFEEDEMEAAFGSVRPERPRNRGSESDLQAWPPVVLRTLELARRCGADSAGCNDGRFDDEIEARWNEWKQMRGMVQAASSPGARFLAIDPNRRGVFREEGYAPDPRWKKIVVPLVGGRGEVIRLDPYQSPGVVWLRNPVVHGEGESEPARFGSGKGGAHGKLAGDDRVVVWGPEPLGLTLPSRFAADRLETQILVQSGTNALGEVIACLRARLESGSRG